MERTRETADSLRWAVSRLATRLRAEQPGPGSLTRLATSVLANLRHAGPATVSGLAEIEGLQPQSLTRTVAALEQDGRIRRERDDADGRAQRISITDAGRDALEEHVAAGNRWLAGALESALTPAERRLLDVAAELLMTVADHHGGRDDPAAIDVSGSDRLPSSQRDLPAPPL